MSTSSSCPQCGEPFGPDQDHCTKCPSENASAHRVVESLNVADPTMPDSSKEGLADETPASSILGVLLVVASCCVAIATTGLLALIVVTQYLMAANDPEATIGFLPTLVSIGMWAAIGYSIAYGLFYLGRARLYPGEYSAPARFQRIIEETEDVDISEITPDNFYSDASPQELYHLYQSLKTKPNPIRLAEIAFEVRYRTGEISQ